MILCYLLPINLLFVIDLIIPTIDYVYFSLGKLCTIALMQVQPNVARSVAQRRWEHVALDDFHLRGVKAQAWRLFAILKTCP